MNPEREIRKKAYAIQRNTEFLRIESGDQDEFLSNDLDALAKKFEYKNENQDWRKYYNATLIVPIWHADVVTQRPPIYGFFTVDSLNKGKHELFTHEETKAILLFGADLMALILLYLEIYDRLPEDEKENHGE